MLIVHIAIALASLIVAGWLYFAPSKNKLLWSYALVAATIATGTYMVFVMPAHMTQTCITGLIYLGFVSYLVVMGRKKLVAN